MKQYLLNLLIALDQLVNTLLGGCPDATISARVYKNSQKYWYVRPLEKIINCIFRLFGHTDHCHQSYLNELNRTHLGSGYK